MCGRYSFFTDSENQEIRRIVNAIDVRYPNNQMKRGEIFPTNVAPILKQKNNQIRSDLSIWGFPRFQSNTGVIINARSETAAERPMFKKSLRERRCVVPSTGFYEWSQNGRKIKFRFRLPDEDTLYMAGIYNEFKGEGRFVILTTKANVSIADVHNRMPVILQKNMVEDWIHNDDFSIPYIHARMPALERQPVSKDM